jgi:hypothetical protein
MVAEMYPEYNDFAWAMTHFLLGIEIGESILIPVEAALVLRGDKKPGPYFLGRDWLPFDMRAKSHLSQPGDWNPEYFDGTASQFAHMWVYTISTLLYGEATAEMFNYLHDPVNNINDIKAFMAAGGGWRAAIQHPVGYAFWLGTGDWESKTPWLYVTQQDYALGVAGQQLAVQMMRALNNGYWRSEGVANWMEDNLKDRQW